MTFSSTNSVPAIMRPYRLSWSLANKSLLDARESRNLLQESKETFLIDAISSKYIHPEDTRTGSSKRLDAKEKSAV